MGHINFSKRKAPCRGVYQLRFRINELRQILPQIHLIIKCRQQELLLEALTLTKQNRGHGGMVTNQGYEKRMSAIYEEIKHLNMKGIDCNTNNVKTLPNIELIGKGGE